jgi:hypothetical protein
VGCGKVPLQGYSTTSLAIEPILELLQTGGETQKEKDSGQACLGAINSRLDIMVLRVRNRKNLLGGDPKLFLDLFEGVMEVP